MIRIRDMELGSGIPKICVPVVETTPEAIRAAARRVRDSAADLLEWRADYLEGAAEPGRIVPVLSEIRGEIGRMPLLFTFRSGPEGGAAREELTAEEYLRLNRAVTGSGQADLVDVELRWGETMMRTLVREAHDAGQRIVASSHDFRKTPSAKEMSACFLQMEDWGADILKQAVMPQDTEDVLRLLGVCRKTALCTERPVVAISMGRAGLESRICAEAFGSALTFGCLGKASAPGQINVEELSQILKILHRCRGGQERESQR